MKRHRTKHKRHQKREEAERRFKKSLVGFAILILASTFICPYLIAEDRFSEGMQSTAKGAFSVPREMAETNEESNILLGATGGVIKGIGDTVVNVADGIFKILTFYEPAAE